jgi:hypothetical protein
MTEARVTEDAPSRSDPAPAPRAPAPRRRPGAGAIIWGSVALFAVMFALITNQLAAGQPPPSRPVVVRKVLKRRVVTTILPTPGRSQVSSGPLSGSMSSAYAPVTTASS